MSDINVNGAQNYYRQSVPRSAIETGILGLGIGAASSTIKNKKLLKEFVNTTVKSDEFVSLALKDKQELVKGMKSIRNNFKNIVFKEAGKTAILAAAAGAVFAMISNALSKKQKNS